jgi:hypothetical protein
MSATGHLIHTPAVKKQCLTDDNSVEWIEEFSLHMTYVGDPVGGSRE